MNHQRRRKRPAIALFCDWSLATIGGADSSRIKEDPTPSFCAACGLDPRGSAIADREEVES